MAEFFIFFSLFLLVIIFLLLAKIDSINHTKTFEDTWRPRFRQAIDDKKSIEK